MSYQALARKWRPRSFTTMVGQEPILRMLGNALEQKRLHHAYLFTGTRGVGKTTLGRILAKCLNCEKDVTSSPCNQCSTCKAIDAGQFLDLYEVDAASRTKVEDTRELLENVMYQPTQGRYKVYLIDEVHMLSNHSFNALLKTLEEPPEYVKFFLCTTDPKRLPITILSRCLQFHLKRINPEQIANHLQHICQVENIQHEVAGLEKIAKSADGSMRDALSLLDQAIAYGHGSVKVEEVHAMLGSMAQDDLLPLLDALANKNAKKVFQKIAFISELSPDFQQVLEELISILHCIAVAQIIPEQLNNDSVLKSFVTRFSPDEIQLYYQIALLGRRDLALTSNPQQGFEMAMLRMLAFKPMLNADKLEVTPSQQLKPSIKNDSKHNLGHAPSASPTDNNLQFSSQWKDILPKLGLSGMAYALASNCVMEEMKDGKVKLILAASHEPMLNQKLKERIAEAIEHVLKQSIHLDITFSKDDLPTPHKEQLMQHEQQLSNAKQAVLENPRIKQLIEMYDATVEVALTE